MGSHFISYGDADGNRYTIDESKLSSPDLYRNKEDVEANSLGNYSNFSIASPSSLSSYLSDFPYWDNFGDPNPAFELVYFQNGYC
jgi:hypothetical protein